MKPIPTENRTCATAGAVNDAFHVIDHTSTELRQRGVKGDDQLILTKFQPLLAAVLATVPGALVEEDPCRRHPAQ